MNYQHRGVKWQMLAIYIVKHCMQDDIIKSTFVFEYFIIFLPGVVRSSENSIMLRWLHQWILLDDLNSTNFYILFQNIKLQWICLNSFYEINITVTSKSEGYSNKGKYVNQHISWKYMKKTIKKLTHQFKCVETNRYQIWMVFAPDLQH